MAEPQRFERFLDALGLPPPVEEAAMNGLGEANEEFERADRAAAVQELAGPLPDLVIRIGMMALDAVGEIGQLVGAVVDGKRAGGLLQIDSDGVGRCAFDADDALEAQLGRAPVELRDRHVVAEGVLHEAQAAWLGADPEARLDDLLIVGIARTEHHAVLAEGDRLPVSIGRDVPDGQ